MSGRPRIPNPKSSRLELRLEPELLSWIDEGAELVDMSRAAFVRGAIVDRLEELGLELPPEYRFVELEPDDS